MKSNEPNEGRRLLTENLPVVQAVVRTVSRLNRLPEDEADEFRSHVYLKLLANDCRILASFRGQSSLRTYLERVVQRLLLDFRVSKWGKWRPSAAARRLGGVGVALDRMVNRDGIPPREAVQIAKSKNPGLGTTDLGEMVERLPARKQRRREGEEVLRNLPASIKSPEAVALEGGRGRWRSRIEAAFARAFRDLDAIDRKILRLRFHRRLTVPAIARRLDLDPKQIYRRSDLLLRRLREALESEGLTAARVRELTGRASGDIQLDFAASESLSVTWEMGRGAGGDTTSSARGAA